MGAGRPSLMPRSLERFLTQPASIRNAVRLIVASTAIVVFVGSLIVWLFDKRDFSNYSDAIWFSLQTVTTVGYGDVVPTTNLGRVVGGVVMLFAIGFITVVTAAITSAFVQGAQKKLAASKSRDEEEAGAELVKRLDEIAARLDRIEDALSTPAPADPGSAASPADDTR